MITVGFTAPATLYKLKWKWNVLYIVAMLDDQRSTLKEDGSIHTRILFRMEEGSQDSLYVDYMHSGMFPIMFVNRTDVK